MSLLGRAARRCVVRLASPVAGEGRVGRRVRIAALRAVLPVLLRTLPLGELLEALGDRGGFAPTSPGPDALLGALRGRRMTCLYRALAGFAVLRARGEDVRFVIGVRRDGAELAAHAWIEQDGRPLGERGEPRERFEVVHVHPPEGGAQGEGTMVHDAVNPDVILTELQDGTGVLLHLGTKFYYALNRTGVAAWRALAEGTATSTDDVARLLAARFAGVAEADARRDVELLFSELRAERLLAAGRGG